MGMNICACGRHQGVGVRALTVHRLAVLLETDGDLRLGVGAMGDRVDLEQA